MTDKEKHFLVGLLIATLFSLINPWLGFGLAVLAGALKEVYDYYQNSKYIKAGRAPIHGVEFLDFLATAAGGAIPLLLYLLVI